MNSSFKNSPAKTCQGWTQKQPTQDWTLSIDWYDDIGHANYLGFICYFYLFQKLRENLPVQLLILSQCIMVLFYSWASYLVYTGHQHKNMIFKKHWLFLQCQSGIQHELGVYLIFFSQLCVTCTGRQYYSSKYH